MINWLLSKMKPCKHRYRYQGRTCDGASLSWKMKPTRSFTLAYQCCDCGKLRHEDGMYFPNDKALHPDCYNDAGWPVDGEGNELEISGTTAKP